jgi:tRNA nucleotidyltransferase (CCA-adding enzyme)
MRKKKVSFVFKRDVIAMDGMRYISVHVTFHQQSAPVTALWGNLEVDVWVPFPKGATVDELQEAALAKAVADSATFAEGPRAQFEIISGA